MSNAEPFHQLEIRILALLDQVEAFRILVPIEAAWHLDRYCRQPGYDEWLADFDRRMKEGGDSARQRMWRAVVSFLQCVGFMHITGEQGRQATPLVMNLAVPVLIATKGEAPVQCTGMDAEKLGVVAQGLAQTLKARSALIEALHPIEDTFVEFCTQRDMLEYAHVMQVVNAYRGPHDLREGPSFYDERLQDDSSQVFLQPIPGTASIYGLVMYFSAVVSAEALRERLKDVEIDEDRLDVWVLNEVLGVGDDILGDPEGLIAGVFEFDAPVVMAASGPVCVAGTVDHYMEGVGRSFMCLLAWLELRRGHSLTAVVESPSPGELMTDRTTPATASIRLHDRTCDEQRLLNNQLDASPSLCPVATESFDFVLPGPSTRLLGRLMESMASVLRDKNIPVVSTSEGHQAGHQAPREELIRVGRIW